jgi:hypothetical protein
MNRNTLMLIGLTFLGLYFLKSKTPHTALDALSVTSPPRAQPVAGSIEKEWWASPSVV